MTDNKGVHAEAWLFFDRDCPICTAIAGALGRILAPRGFGIAALQDPRVAAHLRLSDGELLREMRVLTADGAMYGGADAVIFLARQIWWAWPFYLVAQLPGMKVLLRAAYRWLADHRLCSSGTCSLLARKTRTTHTLAKGGSR